MTRDKRSTHTDALETLGTIIDSTAARDAIHLAVEPIEAGEKLYPGQDVCIVSGKAKMAGEKVLGIVDPFLRGPVQAGERFWLIVYPRQITSLRHVWEHPDFPDEALYAPVECKKHPGCYEGKNSPCPLCVTDSLRPEHDKHTSEQWLRDFAERSSCPDYETLIKAAVGEPLSDNDDDYNSSRNDGDYLTFYGSDAYGEIPPEFWTHVEIVTGKKIPSHLRAQHFSCSC